ncbi:MAG: Hpt domain-containing protein [Nitrospirales bacterium]
MVRVDPDIQALIPGFLENKRRDVTKILGALEQGDFPAIRIIGHSLKGDGGGYGFDAISELGSAIEEAAIAKNGDHIRRRAAEMSSYLDRVEVVFEEE